MSITPPPNHVRVAIVGSGFAGLGAAVSLQREGIDYAVFERGSELGGTWRDNHYPGCRCDVPSHLYSFSFELNPDWSETYSPQPEIYAYLKRTAEKYGVFEKILFNHNVVDIAWDTESRNWRLETSSGSFTSDFVILGNGPLAEPAIPDIAGLETFTGVTFHSAQYRNDYDLACQRVAVIGTGASAIQFIPEIQPVVAQLSVFQRTPPWVLPHPNRRITNFERKIYRRLPIVQRLIRESVYWSREIFAVLLVHNPRVLQILEKAVALYMGSRVKDPKLRKKLIPHYRPGCKRLLLSNNYYPAIQRDNVEVITDAIEEVRPQSIVTKDGTEHLVDTIIFGTGFHVTDNPIADKVRGVDGRTLNQQWSKTGAQAYMGTTVHGFPNLFLLAGPNTGIGHTSLVYMIEAQIGYVIDALHQMEEIAAASIEVRETALEAWSDDVQRRASKTVWNSGGCASWYLDAEGRNTTLWPDYTFRFRNRARHFDMASYEVVTSPKESTKQGG